MLKAVVQINYLLAVSGSRFLVSLKLVGDLAVDIVII